MGCTSSSQGKVPNIPVTPANDETKGPILQSPKKKGKLLRVLVAGYQQAGKSTFFKQMQILYLNGWPEQYGCLL